MFVLGVHACVREMQVGDHLMQVIQMGYAMKPGLQNRSWKSQESKGGKRVVCVRRSLLTRMVMMETCRYCPCNPRTVQCIFLPWSAISIILLALY